LSTSNNSNNKNSNSNNQRGRQSNNNNNILPNNNNNNLNLNNLTIAANLLGLNNPFASFNTFANAAFQQTQQQKQQQAFFRQLMVRGNYPINAAALASLGLASNRQLLDMLPPQQKWKNNGN
jgi:ABC-type antimicrobial peptide transport system ATPase subunit